MSDVTATVRTYIDLWNETSGEARMKGITETFTTDATYTDPMADVAGYDGIDAVMAGAQGQFSGFTFKLLDGVDSNHNIARFRWELVPAGGGESIVIGSDIAVFSEDGKIRSIYGFLDKVPGA
jgi:SnoaL-like domain